MIQASLLLCTFLASFLLPISGGADDKEQDTGCCYSIGFGSRMKPCCLKTKTRRREDECLKGDHVVGAQTGWSKTCPETANVAHKLLRAQAACEVTADFHEGGLSGIQAHSVLGALANDTFIFPWIDDGLRKMVQTSRMGALIKSGYLSSADDAWKDPSAWKSYLYTIEHFHDSCIEATLSEAECVDPAFPYKSFSGNYVICYDQQSRAATQSGPCSSWCTTDVASGDGCSGCCGDIDAKVCQAPTPTPKTTTLATVQAPPPVRVTMAYNPCSTVAPSLRITTAPPKAGFQSVMTTPSALERIKVWKDLKKLLTPSVASTTQATLVAAQTLAARHSSSMQTAAHTALRASLSAKSTSLPVVIVPVVSEGVEQVSEQAHEPHGVSALDIGIGAVISFVVCSMLLEKKCLRGRNTRRIPISGLSAALE